MTEGISQATSTAAASFTSVVNPASMGRDEFLKLLTLQLRSQNPMKPYDNQEFASQLAQFSQLEQLSDIRSLLEEQSKSNLALSQTVSNSALPGMLGKTARVSSESIGFDGENPTELGFTLPTQAAKGRISIYDANGALADVVELSGADLARGDHYFKWDGVGLDGSTVAAGSYNFQVEMADGAGSGYTADTFIFGKIEAVRFKSEGTMLVINGSEAPIGSVTDIAAQ